jgi:uncharacterized protein (DUF1778 family)
MPAAASRRSAAAGKKRRDITINVRATTQWRALVDRAASLLGQSRTEFILDSTRRHAEDVLLDQRLFVLDEKRYQAFVRLLDAPPMPNAELRKLMSSRAPWET